MVVTSNISISHSIFKVLADTTPFPTVFSKYLQTRKNQGLFGKGLNLSSANGFDWTSPTCCCYERSQSTKQNVRTKELTRHVSQNAFYPTIRNLILSHYNPCFQCNTAITNFLVSNTCETRFHDVIGQSTVPMYSCAKIPKHG